MKLIEVSLDRNGVMLNRTADGVWLACEGHELTLSVKAPGPVSARLAGADLALRGVSGTADEWTTRFHLAMHTWAGRARIRVSYQDVHIDEFLDIQPHPDKLGLQAFQEMMKELSSISKDLPWGLSPGSIAATRDAGSSPIIHPAVVELELPILLSSLRQLRADPLIWTERHRIMAPMAAGRHMDPASCRWLITHPSILAAIRPPQDQEAAPEATALVEQGQIRISLDHPATRYICYLLGRLPRVLRCTADKLRTVAAGKAEGWRDPAAQVRAREPAQLVQSAIEQLRQCLGTYPFKHVQPGPPSPAAMQATIDHPLYARVQRTAHRLLDPGLHFDTEGALEASLRRTYDLFELVVLYRLQTLLSRLLTNEKGWTTSTASIRRTNLLENPPGGEFWRASDPHGLTLELRYQQTFEAYAAQSAKSEFRSISSERRPDYVLGLRRGDRLMSWCVVDAKYRTSRTGIHEGLADLHVYRDSLRWDGQPPWGGFIVVPSCQPEARGYITSHYHSQHRFGGLCVAESDWGRPLLDWVGENARQPVP